MKVFGVAKHYTTLDPSLEHKSTMIGHQQESCGKRLMMPSYICRGEKRNLESNMHTMTWQLNKLLSLILVHFLLILKPNIPPATAVYA
jgi:hypothetical protein